MTANELGARPTAGLRPRADASDAGGQSLAKAQIVENASSANEATA